jgi:hypothetical protein
MPDDISALGWLVILCSLGLGFGLVRFLLVTMAEKTPVTPPAEPDPDAAQDRHGEAHAAIRATSA